MSQYHWTLLWFDVFQDKYVLLSLAILCVVSIWHAVVTVFAHYGSVFLKTLERDVFIAFVCIYILCHVVFIFWLYFDVSIDGKEPSKSI